MRKRRKTRAFSILTSNKGESLAETLVAMLIISLSMAFLASSIAASTRIGKKAMEEDRNNLDQWNQAEIAIGKIQNSDPTSGNINKKIIMEYPSESATEEYDGTMINASENGYYSYWLKDGN